MEKIELRNIESLSNIGIEFKKSFSDGIGILGVVIGGAFFAIIGGQYSDDQTTKIALSILGAGIGFVVEYLVQKWRWRKERETKISIYEKKKKSWDDEFILVTSNTMLRIYRQIMEVTREINGLDDDEIRTWGIAKEFRIMSEHFLQRPLKGGLASELPQFIQLCAGMEYEMARFIDINFPAQDFERFREEKESRNMQNKRKEEILPRDPYKSGFEGLSEFLFDKK